MASPKFLPGKEGNEKARKYLEEQGILDKVLTSNPPGINVNTILFIVANNIWNDNLKNTSENKNGIT